MFSLIVSLLISSPASAAELYCYTPVEPTKQAPQELCFDSAEWTNNPDGDMVVYIGGPNFRRQLDEVLPRQDYSVATVSSSLTTYHESCGYNLQSEIILSGIARNQDINFKTLQVSVYLRYTLDNCHAEWKKELIPYKLKL